MIQFKTANKGKIEFGFGPGGQGSEEYKNTVGFYHNGVDWKQGFGSPIRSDNAGMAYKTIAAGFTADNWAAVHILVPLERHDRFMEIILGHVSAVLVDEGAAVKENQIVALEGNRGLVYSGGVRITPEMQKGGDKRGSHVHECWRLTQRVKAMRKGQHYLRTKYGDPYMDKQGFYYEIIDNDNGFKGMIDPRLYDSLSTADKIDKAVEVLRQRKDPDAEALGFMAKLLRVLGIK